MREGTDRELLELAANADGIDIGAEWYEAASAYFLANVPVGSRAWWNPLTDDGDALRLATSLGLAVIPYPIYAKPKHSVICKQYASPNIFRQPSDCLIEQIELYGDDPAAATRRAIVRAAAEIGKARQ